MASAPKKPARPAIMIEQPTLSPKFEQSAPAPVAETSAPVSVVAEVVEAPQVAEAVEAPQVVEAVEAPKVAEAVEAPKVAEAVEAPQAVAKDVGEDVRAIVEKGMVETRAKFAQAKSAAEEATAAVEASLGAAREGVVALNVKALDSVKSAAEAQFELFKSLASAKSMSEFVTLHTEFARARFEEASARSKDLAELARKVADETVAPIKAHVAKTFKVAV